MPADFLWYLAIAALQMAAGAGVLGALRLRVDPEVRLLLGPAALQAVWACTFSLAVAGNVPVRTFTPFVWGGTLLLALLGIALTWRASAAVSSWRLRAPVALLPVWCALLGVLALAPYLGKGLIADYRGSGVPDGWSYVALAQFLWEHAQETSLDGLSLLHRYGAAFAHQRHVASSELGVLSWLIRPGETQMATGLLQALSVWALAMSCAAFARLRGHTIRVAALTAALVALSGWIANVLWLSNYDHSLSLTFAPAMMAVAISAEGLTPGGAVVLGLLAAGTMHTYPELSVVVLGTTAAASLIQAWHDRRLAARLRLAIVTLAVAAALVGVYWPDYVAYLQYQATTRPATAILHGLVEPRFMASAFWALGGEHRVPLLLMGQSLAALLLFVVLALGAARLLRRGDLGLLLALLLFLGGATFGIFVWQYSYGTYKVILSGWWIVAYTLVLAVATPPFAGARRERSRAAATGARLLQAGCAATLLAIPGAVLVRDIVVVPGKQPQPMAALRVLEEIPSRLGQEPLAILVDNLDATAWSLYFLRGLPARQTRIGDFSGYVAAPHLRPFVDPEDAVAWPRFRFVLTDADDRGPVDERVEWRLLWRKGAFALWDTGGRPWALVTDVQSGDEVMVAPLPAVPLGPAVTRFTVLASSAGTLTLTPTDRSLPATLVEPAQLEARCGAAVIAPDLRVSPFALQVPLSPGETACTLRPIAGRAAAGTVSLGRLSALWTPAEESGTPAVVTGSSSHP